MNVKLIHVTPEAEKLIVYMARVSSPNQDNPEQEKLLKYLIKHAHWSPFEMVTMCVEICTSRAISAQILRHRSFQFQETSQRYSKVNSFVNYPARRQDEKNRQNSIDDLSEDVKSEFDAMQQCNWEDAYKRYERALELGIAKECARTLLPLGTATKLYVHGSVRSWLHYCLVRCNNSTQKEHREIAKMCWQIISKELPITAKTFSNLHPDVFHEIIFGKLMR